MGLRPSFRMAAQYQPWTKAEAFRGPFHVSTFGEVVGWAHSCALVPYRADSGPELKLVGANGDRSAVDLAKRWAGEGRSGTAEDAKLVSAGTGDRTGVGGAPADLQTP